MYSPEVKNCWLHWGCTMIGPIKWWQQKQLNKNHSKKQKWVSYVPGQNHMFSHVYTCLVSLFPHFCKNWMFISWRQQWAKWIPLFLLSIDHINLFLNSFAYYSSLWLVYLDRWLILDCSDFQKKTFPLTIH